MRVPLWQWDEGLLEVAGPLVPGALALVPRTVEVVALSTPLSDHDHRRLGRWFTRHPRVALSASDDALGPTGDLSFLRHYSTLRRLRVHRFHTPGPLHPDGLRHLPSTLRELDLQVGPSGEGLQRLADLPELHSLGLAGHRRLPAVLWKLPALRELDITGPVKDLGPLAGLRQLERLKLRSVTADLSPLVALTQLRTLEIRLGSITDLSVLPDVGAITNLELWLVRGLADLGFLADMRHLEGVFLQALRNVRALPDLSRCTALEQVHLETMKGLVDLGPLTTAPVLRQLRMVDCSHLQPEDLLPLKACGALEELGVGMGSDRKNLAARALLAIPGSYGGHPFP